MPDHGYTVQQMKMWREANEEAQERQLVELATKLQLVLKQISLGLLTPDEVRQRLAQIVC